MGGTSEDAIALFGAFGHTYSQNHIYNWSAKNSTTAYVNDFDYALMSAIVRIRTIAGYYEFISNSHDYRTRPLHIKNTRERAEAVRDYVHTFGRDGHKLAAQALGTSEKYLRSVTGRNLSYSPAWVYVRILEQARTLPNEGERDMMPYIGRSSDLEGKLRDYSLESLKTSFAQPLADIMRYLAEPFKSAFTFLQHVSDRPSEWRHSISELQAYAKVLAHNEALLGASAGIWKPTAQQSFVQYLGLNNKSAT
ncbi:hypothetical protein HYU15_04065 [Candidatus Woesearchaeota archaeon]|nr:hypothetical protein [Candidatus Woesearchaeota archaeon]